MAEKPTYKTRPADCDADASRVIAFRALRDQVLDLLEYDAQSVRAQLTELFWQDATFRTFNLARRFSKPGSENASTQSLLASYLSTAYVTREVTEIARLLEQPGDDPKRGVNSLPAVINLIRNGKDAITRDVFVCYDGLPYDYKSAEEKQFEAISRAGGGVQWISTEPTLSEYAHKMFDRLSGKAPSQRRRDDRVKPHVLRWLQKHLFCDEAGRILLLRNKVFAHSADNVSRGPGFKRGSISMNDVDVVHRKMLEVAEVAAAVVSGGMVMPVASAPNDTFDGLERPFVFETDVQELADFWLRYSDDRENWSQKAIDAAPCKVKPEPSLGSRPAKGKTKPA